MGHWRSIRRLAALLGVALGTATLAGCGSGRHPDTGGVDPAAYMARFSGQWELDRNVSEDPRQVLGVPDEDPRTAVEPPPDDGLGVPGRRAGRRGELGRSAPDPGAVRATVLAFRAVPDRFTLAVRDSVVATTWVGDGEARMRVAGDGAVTSTEGRRGVASVEWNGGELEIERRFDGAGSVVLVDVVETLPEHDRLLITRTLEGLPGGQRPTVRLAFDRIGEP